MGVKGDGNIKAAKAAVAGKDQPNPNMMAQMMGMMAQARLDPIDRIAAESMGAAMREFTYLLMRAVMRAEWERVAKAGKPEQWRRLGTVLDGFKLVSDQMGTKNVAKVFTDAIAECENKAKKLEGGADDDVGNQEGDKGPAGKSEG